MKKIMMLGGSRFLIPVIQSANDLGYYVITCDYLPNNIAHRFSDEYQNVSVIDKDAVLKIARDLKIDGILSFACDPGVVTAAYVAECMGLPTCGPYESVKILQNKAKFRAFLRKNGFNVPKAKGYSLVQEAKAELQDFYFPVIVKPVDSAGSKGVTKIDDIADLEHGIENALKYSLSNQFIIEEFIQQNGFPSDSDCFSIDGEFKFISFSSQYFDTKSPNPCTPSAYSWPSTILKENQAKLKYELQRLISLLKMETSIYNVETRIGIDGNVYIMEVSPRGGGNRLAELLRCATGVDLIKSSVLAAVGEKVQGLCHPICKSFWANIILHSNRAGIYKDVYIEPKIAQNNLRELDIYINPGDSVNVFTGAHEILGTMFLEFDSQEELAEAMANQKKWIQILLENER